MQAYEISELLKTRPEPGRLYFEFLRTPDLSAGLYRLAAGSLDPQLPHTEDEVYYVIGGRGMVRVELEDRGVKPGSVIFVPKEAAHKFHSIEEDLTLLVFFAPATHSRAAAD